MKVCKNRVLNYRAISFILFVVVITLTLSCAKKEPELKKIE